jgi:hypothetical protein
MGHVHAHARTHESAFALTTGDPRFDPTAPVTVNGYRYAPPVPVATYPNATDEDGPALLWLSERYRNSGPITPEDMWTTAEMLVAFAGGRASAIAERAVADVTQAIAMSALGLLAEAARLFRRYEAHHQAKVDEGRSNHGHAPAGGVEKVKRNADMADRIEAFLADPTTPRDTLTGLALSLVQDIDELIGNSEGVAGLRMISDVTPWSSLTEGGEFGAWLGSFDRLRDALDEAMPARAVQVDDPAATVRTIEAAAEAGLIKGLDPEVLSALRQAHDGAA